MKKTSPYMLVRKASLGDAASAIESSTPKPTATGRVAKTRAVAASKGVAGHAEAKRIVDHLLVDSPQLASRLRMLEPKFRKALLDSYPTPEAHAPPRAGKGKGTGVLRAGRKLASVVSMPGPAALVDGRRVPAKKTSSRADSLNYPTQVKRALRETTSSDRIGLLDLGVWIAGLPDLLSRLNAFQDAYTWFEINAPVPSGLRKTPEGMDAWMRSHGVRLSKAKRAALEPHVIADEFFTVAGDIRSGMGLDMVIGLVPVMVAGDLAGELYWNHFSSVSDGSALVSTTDLRDFAARAERPFEAAIGVLLVGALLVRFNAKLGYHTNRGCVLDYNEDRTSLIEIIRTPKICSGCGKQMDAAQLGAADAMLNVLRKMKRKVP